MKRYQTNLELVSISQTYGAEGMVKRFRACGLICHQSNRPSLVTAASLLVVQYKKLRRSLAGMALVWLDWCGSSGFHIARIVSPHALTSSELNRNVTIPEESPTTTCQDFQVPGSSLDLVTSNKCLTSSNKKLLELQIIVNLIPFLVPWSSLDLVRFLLCASVKDSEPLPS